jgi:hypothetical protein
LQLTELVGILLADQTNRVSDIVEHVSDQYRLIDEQVEADRKRRRTEVTISAGALDSELGRELAAKYTDIVAKILQGSGLQAQAADVFPTGTPVRVGSGTTCTPIVGFSPPGTDLGET